MCYITQHPGSADEGSFPAEMRTTAEPPCKWKQLRMYHFNSILLKGEKNVSIALALGNYFSLVFIDLHKISYKYYVEPESLTVVFFLTTSIV